jgi:hypothetical protein
MFNNQACMVYGGVSMLSILFCSLCVAFLITLCATMYNLYSGEYKRVQQAGIAIMAVAMTFLAMTNQLDKFSGWMENGSGLKTSLWIFGVFALVFLAVQVIKRQLLHTKIMRNIEAEL